MAYRQVWQTETIWDYYSWLYRWVWTIRFIQSISSYLIAAYILAFPEESCGCELQIAIMIPRLLLGTLLIVFVLLMVICSFSEFILRYLFIQDVPALFVQTVVLRSENTNIAIIQAALGHNHSDSFSKDNSFIYGRSTGNQASSIFNLKGYIII